MEIRDSVWIFTEKETSSALVLRWLTGKEGAFVLYYVMCDKSVR